MVKQLKYLSIFCIFPVLSACTPADELYCNRLEQPGSPGWQQCLGYYHAQKAAFQQDYDFCRIEADRVYPPYLYDYGGYARTPIYGGWGWPHHRYYGGATIYVEPDYQRNAELTALRERIIEPCMQSRGWNSGSDWMAGRHAVAPARRARSAPNGERLPWQQ